MTLPIVLASASPRRRSLLEALGIDLTIITSDAEEIFEGDPATVVQHNAALKRDGVVQRLEAPALVIAADTLVVREGVTLGKPGTLDEARHMLRRLSGGTHEVLTGVALWDGASGQRREGVELTHVVFREISDADINAFVEAVKPLDRAGAYTAEGPGSLLIKGFEGCYQNVLGLPIVCLDTLLHELGYSLFSLMNPAQARFR